MLFSGNKNHKRLFIFGQFFKIRKLTQLDFIEDGGIPISLFNVVGAGGRDASKSIFAAIKTDEEKTKEKEVQKEIVKKILNMAVIKPKNFRPGSLKWEQAFLLYAVILDFSLNKFKRIFDIEKNRILLIDAMAKRYGKTPAEWLSPEEKFSDLERGMFNSFIAVNAITHEIEIHNKSIEEQKRMLTKGKR